jgi:hypothetical protein
MEFERTVKRIAEAGERIATALERIAENQEKVIGLNQDADAFVRVVTGARTS